MREYVDDDNPSDEDAFRMVAQLNQMQLIIRMSAHSELDDIYYRCNADFEYVDLAAKKIGIKVQQYLE